VIPVTAKGVSAAKVVAIIEIPSHHQGKFRSATKYDSIPVLAFLDTQIPRRKTKTK
jgi:hypothetical protein